MNHIVPKVAVFVFLLVYLFYYYYYTFSGNGHFAFIKFLFLLIIYIAWCWVCSVAPIMQNAGGNVYLIQIINRDSKTKYLFKNNLSWIIVIILIVSHKGLGVTLAGDFQVHLFSSTRESYYIVSHIYNIYLSLHISASANIIFPLSLWKPEAVRHLLNCAQVDCDGSRHLTSPCWQQDVDLSLIRLHSDTFPID